MVSGVKQMLQSYGTASDSQWAGASSTRCFSTLVSALIRGLPLVEFYIVTVALYALRLWTSKTNGPAAWFGFDNPGASVDSGGFV